MLPIKTLSIAAGGPLSDQQWLSQNVPEAAGLQDVNRRSKMLRWAMTTLLILVCLLSALNAFALVLNISLQSKAAVSGMSYEDLVRDQDFTRAVKSIVQECKVNVDIAKVICEQQQRASVSH
jgi:hypothetical protein